MDETIRVSGKTLEDAITEATIKLGVTSDNIVYTIVEHESRGFLGIGARNAVIDVRKKTEADYEAEKLRNKVQKHDSFRGTAENGLYNPGGKNNKKTIQDKDVNSTDISVASSDKKDQGSQKDKRVSGADLDGKGLVQKVGEGVSGTDLTEKDQGLKKDERILGTGLAGKGRVWKKEDVVSEISLTEKDQGLKKDNGVSGEDLVGKGQVQEEEDEVSEVDLSEKKRGQKKEGGISEIGLNFSSSYENVHIRNDSEGDYQYYSDAKREKNLSRKKLERTYKSIENPDEVIAKAENFLSEVCNAMDIEAEFVSKLESDVLYIVMNGDDMGIMIGKRGQTLDSLQYLVSLVVNKNSSVYVHVKLDTENYRFRRRETLENLAKNIAVKVKKTRQSIYLEPMNPYERRIIHSTLQNDPFVTTHSEGEDPDRKVVVTLKKDADLNALDRKYRDSRTKNRYGKEKGRGGHGENKGNRRRGRNKKFSETNVTEDS